MKQGGAWVVGVVRQSLRGHMTLGLGTYNGVVQRPTLTA